MLHKIQKELNLLFYKLDEYKQKYENLIKPQDIIIHAPYIINPTSKDKSKSSFAIDFLIKEIERMNYIGAKYLVLHPGSYTKYHYKSL
ncbi:putative endonuclease 4 [Mycoplasmopsis caviae]|uniref:Putative endonuclease 4 n=1 Tax=Mycoplasmopsis caviae TaxID=55603 RepID=A0A3P8KB15_9BACT|nr:putative endonuclease 4 [Mycoplasmopsis caviae]